VLDTIHTDIIITMNVINEIQRINALELEKNLTHTSGSWHTKYKDSSWVYAGNLPNNLTEGDIICIVSQYGEIEDINLVRDSDTGKSKGFAFIKYEDARSCVLAVDNLTGSQVLGRTLRVDHVEKYRLPKHLQEKEDENDKGNGNDDDGGESASSNNSGIAEAGHAYKDQELASSFNIQSGQDLFAPPPPPAAQKNESNEQSLSSNAGDIGMGSGDDKEERKRRKLLRAQKRKEKEEHKRKKEERKRRKKYHDSSSSKHKSSHRDR
jgi:RNA-binding motif protein, X-linked 2